MTGNAEHARSTPPDEASSGERETSDEVLMVATLLGLVPLVGLLYMWLTLRPVAAAMMSVLVGFVPLTAVSYYLWRRRVRKRTKCAELTRIGEDWSKLHDLHKHDYRPWHFFLAVAFTTAVTAMGVASLFHVSGPSLVTESLPVLLSPWGDEVSESGIEGYQQRALTFFGLAFLGAYLWGLQNLLSRYFANDLLPGVYYNLGVRMIFAALLALLLFHSLSADGDTPAAELLPALAFLLGMFPQRALQYLTDKLSLFIQPPDKTANELPLEVIQGVSVSDRMRLAESGVASTFDLATADFVGLLAATPYRAEKLIDWILQAKLALGFPDSLEQLRQNGVRTVLDLKRLDKERIDALVADTALTRNSLCLGIARVDTDPSVAHLRRYIARLRDLSEFGERPPAFPASPVTGADDDADTKAATPPSAPCRQDAPIAAGHGTPAAAAGRSAAAADADDPA